VVDRQDRLLSIYRQQKDWLAAANFLSADICSALFTTFFIR
jgi:hypothetical protein